jgi:hypothetical protein
MAIIFHGIWKPLDYVAIVFILGLFRLTRAQDLKDNSASCSCYAVTSGDTQQYFQYHRFYDFRYLSNSSSDYLVEPDIVTDSQDAERSPNQDVLNSISWNNDWNIVSWGTGLTTDATVVMRNSPANVYISTPC